MIFNEADLLERLGGDAELAGEVIAVFLDDCPLQLAAIDAAAAVANAVELRVAAHALKGAAGSLGGTRLFEAAQALEHLAGAEAGSVQDTVAAVGDVAVAAGELLAVLRNRATVPTPSQ